MPWLQVNILTGTEQSVLEELMLALSKETARILGVPQSIVRVLINEYEPSRWAVGGAPIVPVFEDRPADGGSGEPAAPAAGGPDATGAAASGGSEAQGG